MPKTSPIDPRKLQRLTIAALVAGVVTGALLAAMGILLGYLA
ncbi:hypothetical protein [Telluria aromaticivorans]|nr:hypothetical protein [Telluria aromaticivorans]